MCIRDRVYGEDEDANSTNELLDSVNLIGNNLNLYDAGGIKTVDLSVVSGPTGATGATGNGIASTVDNGN